MAYQIRFFAVAIAGMVALSSSVAAEDAAPEGKNAKLAPGSSAFCLYELPPVEDKRRWVNLGIVQYLEYNRNEIRMYYGGGNLGSGHEVRIPAANPEQLEEVLERLRRAAASCR